MTRPLTLGFSPCPNDTFIFNALIHRLVETEGLHFIERLEDVETLNQLSREGRLDVSKVSFHALAFLRDDYWLLRSGGALGRGCGPLVVSRKLRETAELRGGTIAVPGPYTTAALLLKLFDPSLERLVVLPFHTIMDAVANGEVDAGVIIHESRFTYPSYGLEKLVDLGEWWESATGLPIPLGGIVVRKTLGEGVAHSVERAIRASIDHAMRNPASAAEYIRRHAQEMKEEVCAAHIDLYVNGFSRQLGEEGERAVQALLVRGEEAGIVPKGSRRPFVP